jgi:threonine dehydrogenase-like Zn-dependent dehydrogenase
MRGALGLGRDGGMRERFLAPPAHLLALPPELPVENASIVEPLAVSLHGIRLARLQRGQRVAVLGGGAIGLLAVAGLQGRGVEVALRARHQHQIELGERLGARPAQGEYDVVIEAAGSRSGLAEALELCAAGATLIVLGVYDDGIPLPMMAFYKEIAVKSSLGYCLHGRGRDFDDAIALLAARPDIAAALITHRFPLADAVEAFRVAADRRSGAIRVVLHP